MKYVAYNCFPPNEEKYLSGIVQATLSSEIDFTHIGRSDPPKKWTWNSNELLEMLTQGNDDTNYIFARDTTRKIEIDFTLGTTQKSTVSMISISGPRKETVEDLCLHYAKHVNSFICFSGQLGSGSNQTWTYLMRNEHCPASLLEQIGNSKN